MHNLQLQDTISGGHFVFTRNDYPIDQGIYSELYVTLFGTSSAEWWADNAFNTNTVKVSSRTGIALKTNSTVTESNINIIKKAVEDDLKRFTNKNENIEVEKIAIGFSGNAILIVIELTGYNEPFNFIYNETNKSLENVNWQTY